MFTYIYIYIIYLLILLMFPKLWKATRIVEFIMNLWRWKRLGAGAVLVGNKLSFKLSEPRFSLFPLTVDSPDLLLGMVHNCDSPDGGAVRNSSEGCHWWHGEVASWAPSPSLYLVWLGGKEDFPELPSARKKHWMERDVSFPCLLIHPRRKCNSFSLKIGGLSMARKGQCKAFPCLPLPPFSPLSGFLPPPF